MDKLVKILKEVQNLVQKVNSQIFTRVHQLSIKTDIYILYTPLAGKGVCGLSSPRFARAFHELRRYHTTPLRLHWGPENVPFRKRHFWDPNINVKI